MDQTMQTKVKTKPPTLTLRERKAIIHLHQVGVSALVLSEAFDVPKMSIIGYVVNRRHMTGRKSAK